ncbi:MAG: AAA family ATPase [Firmicutes bacterium]|nr:AAA family ATPase [Bacillota bacterium]
MILKKVEIHEYKSIDQPQVFDVEDDITTFVGMNESGKTSILEAIAKSNYFDSGDVELNSFDKTNDYPRKRLVRSNKSGDNPKAITLHFDVQNLKQIILEKTGIEIDSNVSVTKYYDNKTKFDFNVKTTPSDFYSKFSEIENTLLQKLILIKTKQELNAEIVELKKDPETNATILTILGKINYYVDNSTYEHPFASYLVTEYLIPNLPKFMYYDEYYALDSEFSISQLANNQLTKNSAKTAKALIELADIDLKSLSNSTNFERYNAELNSASLEITEELFKYWKSNVNLEIIFMIEKIESNPGAYNHNTIVDRVLKIRVKNSNNGVDLPLGNRSKGFNWFFSFLVWFNKIQEKKDSKYILLLDEPGLNLHGKAQADLLNFFADLSANYQILYTTHSPFMIEPHSLNKIRTVFESTNGTVISDTVQEKDPNTLFPLQAALGYDLAQNLFISPKNLVVEGIADLTYIELISSILEQKNRESLNSDITIVPIGGADRVSTFISLLRGNKLEKVILFDTITNQSAKDKINNTVKEKLIRDSNILYYHNFAGTEYADIEDLFDTKEYIELYNKTFKVALDSSKIDPNKPIIKQIILQNGGKDYNHYLPAKHLMSQIETIAIPEKTLNKFEEIFKKVNKLFTHTA